MNPILSPSKSKINPQEEEIYRALVRNLRRHLGFGILFVCCTPEQEQRIIKQVAKDLPQKKIAVLSLEGEIYNLYELIEEQVQQQPINICFITGIEKSFVNYIKPGIGGQGDYYKTDTVPPILGHLNLQRERFRDNFNCCLVFFVPWFGLKYFVRRSPDFYDWRSGVFCFPVDIEQESFRILEDRDYNRYLQLTPQERNQKILELKDLITQTQLPDAEKAELWHEIGRLYYANQEYDRALACFNLALEIKPDDYYACWNNRGSALGNLGRHEEALAAFVEALKINPDQQHEVLNNQGIALSHLGRYEDAILAFDKALKIKPDFQTAWNNRGVALSNLGRYEDAILAFDKALKIKPDFQTAWNNRGVALFKLGQYEDALKSHDRVLELNPNDPSAYYNKACCYGLQNNINLAIENLQRAINLDKKYRDMAKTDNDFDRIRSDARFQALLSASS